MTATFPQVAMGLDAGAPVLLASVNEPDAIRGLLIEDGLIDRGFLTDELPKQGFAVRTDRDPGPPLGESTSFPSRASTVGGYVTNRAVYDGLPHGGLLAGTGANAYRSMVGSGTSGPGTSSAASTRPSTRSKVTAVS